MQTSSPVSSPARIFDLTEIASKTGDLPALPGIALKVYELTKDPNTSGRQLEEVIKRDQSLAARMLQIVNSAMYSLPREVSTISHAVAILGLETVRSVVMASAMQNLFRSGMRHSAGLGTKLLWDHSTGAAIAARTLAKLVRYPDPEEAFLCGLMHDIGKPVLLQKYPKEYDHIFSQVYLGAGPFYQLELDLFGFSHGDVGALVSNKWNFPRKLSAAIQFHHDAASATENPQLACIANLAHLVMVYMEVGFEKDSSLELDKQPAAESLGLDAKKMESALTEIRNAITQMPNLIR